MPLFTYTTNRVPADFEHACNALLGEALGQRPLDGRLFFRRESAAFGCGREGLLAILTQASCRAGAVEAVAEDVLGAVTMWAGQSNHAHILQQRHQVNSPLAR